MNTRKLYFFDHNKTKSITIIILLLRIVGCMMIGQRIMSITNEEGSVHIYMYYK